VAFGGPVILILSLFVTSQLAFAQARLTAAASTADIAMTLDFADRIQLATQSEVENFKKLNLRVRSGDHSLCTFYRGQDMSGCTKTLIRSLTAHSALGVRAMLDLPVTAAMKDRDLGVGDKRAGFLLADDFMTIVEGIRPEKFFVKTVLAKSKQDRADKKAAVANENKLLEDFRTQALPSAESHLAKTEAIRPSANPEILAWERSKAHELHDRLGRLKSRRWQIQ
jgi:hypothetical protein